MLRALLLRLPPRGRFLFHLLRAILLGIAYGWIESHLIALHYGDPGWWLYVFWYFFLLMAPFINVENPYLWAGLALLAALAQDSSYWAWILACPHTWSWYYVTYPGGCGLPLLYVPATVAIILLLREAYTKAPFTLKVKR